MIRASPHASPRRLGTTSRNSPSLNPVQPPPSSTPEEDASKDILSMLSLLKLSAPVAVQDSVNKSTSNNDNSSPSHDDNQISDDEIDTRPLNATELSLWNSLKSSATPVASATSPVQTPTRPTPSTPVSKALLKKNKTTNDPNDKRDFLFGGLAPDLRVQLQLDDVAQYSVTDMKTAARISHFLMTLPGLSPDSVVTDATACVGGNTASFCTFFRYVQAVEIDATRFQMLVHNLHAVMSYVNAQCFCANYVDVVECFGQDVVFVDPPWGGPEYRSRSTVDLFLGDTPLADVCERLVGRTQYVVIKVPENFDLDKLTRHVSGTVGYVASFRKMGLVVVDYRFVSLVHSDDQDLLASKFYS
ncbi:hypothetical protein DYB28_004396 [Aphanomyces astaci]|uniref:Trimethylguanosine synthase n=1 Tax=Aphanomyces astaci TaxID=112090 RepID=A0A9X8HGB8_APHAT|nr:hypothetical protein DYB28_004396 [Aphanomyces astaci]